MKDDKNKSNKDSKSKQETGDITDAELARNQDSDTRSQMELIRNIQENRPAAPSEASINRERSIP